MKESEIILHQRRTDVQLEQLRNQVKTLFDRLTRLETERKHADPPVPKVEP